MNRLVVLIVVSLSNFLTPFMGSAVSVALPAISGEFKVSAENQIWVMMAFQLTTALFLLPMGRLADLVGRVRIFRLGLAGFTVTSLLLTFPPSWGLLLGARALQGVAGSMIFCTGIPIFLSAYPPAERGRILGYNVAAVYLGLSLGPVLGGVLTEALGWRSIFGFSTGLGLGALVLTAWKLPLDRPAEGVRRFDAAGSVLYGVSILALVGSFSLLPHPGDRALGTLFLLAGLAGLVAFVRFERRTAQPILDLGLFRNNPAFTFSNLAALINYSASASVGILLSLYLQHLKGLPANRAGLVLLTQPALMAALSPLAGRISDRIQPRVVASLGMGVLVAGLVVLFFLTPATPLPVILGALVLLGVGFAFFSSPNTNAVMSSVPASQYAVATAILSTMRLAGHVLSMGLIMLFFAMHMGSEPLARPVYPQFLASLRTAFPVLAGLGVLGIFASLARGNVKLGSP
jgi:EmrB/QacA subfamily drug resistance transporter